jgi:hypothetical protein
MRVPQKRTKGAELNKLVAGKRSNGILKKKTASPLVDKIVSKYKYCYRSTRKNRRKQKKQQTCSDHNVSY